MRRLSRLGTNRGEESGAPKWGVLSGGWGRKASGDRERLPTGDASGFTSRAPRSLQSGNGRPGLFR